MDSLERLLHIDPHLDPGQLRSLVDETHNPRQSLPALFTRTESEYVTQMCDFYLGQLPVETERELYGSRLQPKELLTARLMLARDDLIATRTSSKIFRSFASRHDDRSATSNGLVAQLSRRFPQGTIARFDPRDFLFYSSVAADTDRQAANVRSLFSNGTPELRGIQPMFAKAGLALVESSPNSCVFHTGLG